MRAFSFRDLQLIPCFKGMSEQEMLSLEVDETMAPILEELGFDLNQPILYVPSKHRDMQGRVAVGYRACGSISQNREFLNSALCEPIDRVIATAQYDISLTEQLSSLMGTSAIDFSQSISSADFAVEDIPGDVYVEPDYEEVELQLRMMKWARDKIRGTPFNEYGSLKTLREYHDE